MFAKTKVMLMLVSILRKTRCMKIYNITLKDDLQILGRSQDLVLSRLMLAPRSYWLDALIPSIWTPVEDSFRIF